MENKRQPTQDTSPAKTEKTQEIAAQDDGAPASGGSYIVGKDGRRERVHCTAPGGRIELNNKEQSHVA